MKFYPYLSQSDLATKNNQITYSWYLLNQVISPIAWYLILSYLDLTRIFYLVTDGETIDIVNVLIAIVSGGERFSMISLRRERILSCYLTVWF